MLSPQDIAAIRERAEKAQGLTYRNYTAWPTLDCIIVRDIPALLSHIEELEAKLARNYPCKLCRMTFATERELEQHIASHFYA